MEKTGLIAIALISIIGVVGVMMLDPIPQDIKYHLFLDQRTIFGIPNFWNVISNLPFLLIGLIGLRGMFRTPGIRYLPEIRVAYILFFAGVSLVAFGSGYYHLRPGNETLLWDRLPMTIAFMALFSVIIAEFVSVRAGKIALLPLIMFGAFSVFYWHRTEGMGQGDLRLYVLVQFLPILIIPLMLLFFKPKFTCTSGYWWLLLAYVLAKVFEYFDEPVFNMLSLSGHSIKHVIAASGVLILIIAYYKREPAAQEKDSMG